MWLPHGTTDIYLNITAGKKLKKNWEIGAKFRFLGGSPYTPYDIELVF